MGAQERRELAEAQAALARAWPALAQQLGNLYAARFAEHCARTPLLPLHGPLRDGWQLAEALETEGTLEDRAAFELLSRRLQFILMRDGAAPSCGWGWARVKTTFGSVWGVRLLGRTFNVMLPWPRARPAPSPLPRSSSRST